MLIGNNVYIATEVKIAGKVIIDNNVEIDAGAVVVKNIPSNVTIAGVLAMIISHNSLEIHMNYLKTY